MFYLSTFALLFFSFWFSTSSSFAQFSVSCDLSLTSETYSELSDPTLGLEQILSEMVNRQLLDWKQALDWAESTHRTRYPHDHSNEKNRAMAIPWNHLFDEIFYSDPSVFEKIDWTTIVSTIREKIKGTKKNFEQQNHLKRETKKHLSLKPMETLKRHSRTDPTFPVIHIEGTPYYVEKYSRVLRLQNLLNWEDFISIDFPEDESPFSVTIVRKNTEYRIVALTSKPDYRFPQPPYHERFTLAKAYSIRLSGKKPVRNLIATDIPVRFSEHGLSPYYDHEKAFVVLYSQPFDPDPLSNLRAPMNAQLSVIDPFDDIFLNLSPQCSFRKEDLEFWFRYGGSLFRAIISSTYTNTSRGTYFRIRRASTSSPEKEIVPRIDLFKRYHQGPIVNDNHAGSPYWVVFDPKQGIQIINVNTGHIDTSEIKLEPFKLDKRNFVIQDNWVRIEGQLFGAIPLLGNGVLTLRENGELPIKTEVLFQKEAIHQPVEFYKTDSGVHGDTLPPVIAIVVTQSGKLKIYDPQTNDLVAQFTLTRFSPASRFKVFGDTEGNIFLFLLGNSPHFPMLVHRFRIFGD